jgi:hypothetical protein
LNKEISTLQEQRVSLDRQLEELNQLIVEKNKENGLKLENFVSIYCSTP